MDFVACHFTVPIYYIQTFFLCVCVELLDFSKYSDMTSADSENWTTFTIIMTLTFFA